VIAKLSKVRKRLCGVRLVESQELPWVHVAAVERDPLDDHKLVAGGNEAPPSVTSEPFSATLRSACPSAPLAAPISRPEGQHPRGIRTRRAVCHAEDRQGPPDEDLPGRPLRGELVLGFSRTGSPPA
jgi:hypothetical protein